MEIPKNILADFDYKAYFFYQRVGKDAQDEKLIEAEKKAFIRGLKIGYEARQPEKKTWHSRIFHHNKNSIK